MSDLHTFLSLITFQFVLLLLLVAYSVDMVSLNCPLQSEVQGGFEVIPYNQTNPLTSLNTIWLTFSLIFTGCSGIPWWIYIIVFIPSIIAIIVYVVPFIGS